MIMFFITILNLTNVVIPKIIKLLSVEVFDNNNLESLVLYDSLRSIKKGNEGTYISNGNLLKVY